MTISEDKRLITIVFDLSAVFSIGIDLETEAAATPVNGVAQLASYVEAVKCSSTSNAGDPADTSALAANTDLYLYVCVRSTSSEVALASIDEMVRIISFFLVPYAYHSTTLYKYNKDTHLLSFLSHILRSKDISGFASDGNPASLEVIDAGSPKYSAFTSTSVLPSSTEIRVKTRVPASTFDYNGNTQTITIDGSATMAFAGRKLLVSVYAI